MPLRHAVTGTIVEISWRPANNSRLFVGLAGSSPGQEIALSGGGGIRTPTDQDLSIYLCVHGAGHAWNRLKWLADMHALLAQFDPSELPGLYQAARRCGSEICFGQGLLMCERIFGYPLSGELADRLRGSGRLRYLTTAALKKLPAPTPSDLKINRIFGGAPARLYCFLLGRGWAFWREQCRIVSVQGLDVVTFPLPPRLFFLYPALRIPFFFWRRILWLREKQA
jgi:hypothetical protein